MVAVAHGLIVGGGIAGLASAIALEQIGVHCDVAEIGDFGTVGAGIGIAGRAPNALQELGVYDEVAATGQPGLGAPAMYDLTGTLVAAPPPPAPIPGGLEPIGAYRPALAEVLLRRARQLGARLETGLSVTSIEEDDDAAVVTMSTGERRRYDFVIGADGAYSTVRSLVFPDAPEPAYAGQMSIRWVFDSEPIDGEGWYLAGPMGRLALYYQPHPRKIYAPLVVNMPRTRLSQQDAYEVVREMTGLFSAEAIVELRKRLSPDDEIIPRPFDWILLEEWHRGRTLLIGDAAHATTAHLGMGGGMALEDGVVLAKCIAQSDTLEEAYQAFFRRRWERVRTVVETSVELSRREQANLPPGPENARLMGAAIAVLGQPY